MLKAARGRGDSSREYITLHTRRLSWSSACCSISGSHDSQANWPERKSLRMGQSVSFAAFYRRNNPNYPKQHECKNVKMGVSRCPVVPSGYHVEGITE